MTIAALPSMVSAAPATRTFEASQGPGPDKDGDAHHKGAVNQTAISSAPLKGMGVSVDTSA